MFPSVLDVERDCLPSFLLSIRFALGRHRRMSARGAENGAGGRRWRVIGVVHWRAQATIERTVGVGTRCAVRVASPAASIKRRQEKGRDERPREGRLRALPILGTSGGEIWRDGGVLKGGGIGAFGSRGGGRGGSERGRGGDLRRRRVFYVAGWWRGATANAVSRGGLCGTLGGR
ncbi:hypothetical protein MPTK1_8g03780 [Marchantia polymorpha subsp. ruderalis]|uniref:Uncharacterized protein n=1 Tax=Marchantia polymorpha TaxID=3197 RepID=A0A2R6XJI8_MARPO|nr:hypothetical protein MARPO_0012s0168 [Marchantia polymorpha]BBN18594.1 hypothetical protein Mp_8g03780 [Marchantia polymorpha subsp. ruderalis]|eukprot:PTQ46241.1 hypothetical protein MARPO_0012s0168 [Marchantia polymorpha]